MYSIDKVQIVSSENITCLKDKLPEELTKNCGSFNILRPSDQAIKFGLNSRLEISVPTKEFFKKLSTHENVLGRYYISYIELAFDEGYGSEFDAEMASIRLNSILWKKYVPEEYVYEGGITKPKDDSLFADSSKCLGNSDFKLALYARKSKLNNQPCVHYEWRIRESKRISSKLGVKTIEDIINLDKHKTYTELMDTYIRMGLIDNMKLGKWILGIDGRRRKFTKREKMKIGLSAITFCNRFKIKTYGKLADYIMKEKTRIKAKQGRRAAWETKLLKIEPSRFLLPL